MLFSLSRSCYIAPYSLGANWGGRCSRLRPAGLFNFGCSMYKAPIDYQAARLFYGCNEVSCHCFRLRATAPQPPQHTRYPNSLAAKLRPSSPATTHTSRHTYHDTHVTTHTSRHTRHDTHVTTHIPLSPTLTFHSYLLPIRTILKCEVRGAKYEV